MSSSPEIHTNWFKTFAKTCWVNTSRISKQAEQASITFKTEKVMCDCLSNPKDNKTLHLFQRYHIFLGIYSMNSNKNFSWSEGRASMLGTLNKMFKMEHKIKFYNHYMRLQVKPKINEKIQNKKLWWTYWTESITSSIAFLVISVYCDDAGDKANNKKSLSGTIRFVQLQAAVILNYFNRSIILYAH